MCTVVVIMCFKPILVWCTAAIVYCLTVLGFFLHFYLHYLTATGISCSIHNAFNRRTTNMISSYVSAWKKMFQISHQQSAYLNYSVKALTKPDLWWEYVNWNYDGGNSDGVLTSAQVNAQQTYLYYTKKKNCSFITIWLPPPNPCPLGAHQHFLEIELGRKRWKQTGAKYAGHVATEQQQIRPAFYQTEQFRAHSKAIKDQKVSKCFCNR